MLPDPENVMREPQQAGGPDPSPSASPLAVDLINGAANVWVPKQMEAAGGWQVAVRSIGIVDTAQDHRNTENEPDACTAPPQSVVDRINAEGGNRYPVPPIP